MSPLCQIEINLCHALLKRGVADRTEGWSLQVTGHAFECIGIGPIGSTKPFNSPYFGLLIPQPHPMHITPKIGHPLVEIGFLVAHFLMTGKGWEGKDDFYCWCLFSA